MIWFHGAHVWHLLRFVRVKRRTVTDVARCWHTVRNAEMSSHPTGDPLCQRCVKIARARGEM